MKKYVCIHGHFYQPPRENPWLEAVELQDSAYPYHDWNERITAEGYSPNTAARILDAERRIIDIVNNYSKISFNMGPTLLSWMEKHMSDVYEEIIEADRISQENFSGHGAAIAQVYNHMIMPLANTRDKRTQVMWGIMDFESRFGRKPEGMWLPETAVDLATLDVLAEFEIRFTILSPYQAAKIKNINEDNWSDVSGGKVDPKRPYLCKLPSGKEITVFFYDGPISQEVGFGSLLENGENFAKRLLGTFSPEAENSQLVHIATDGETYGHHKRNGDMALAYCLHHIESNDQADLTIYAEYLEKNPPKYETQIIENTSWSCVHGIERWRSNCGCNTGHQGWNQEWRGPLRDALDSLRQKLIQIYEKEMSALSENPWKMRDEYISVILNRSAENVEKFLSQHCSQELTYYDSIRCLKLLELQRNAMLMYTSCGWFFDEISGIETTQVLQYAARAIQLSREITGKDLEPDFVKALEKAPSNVPEYKNGANVYDKLVKPGQLDLLRVGAHYAISSLFNEYPESVKIYCYNAQSRNYEVVRSGKLNLALGRARVQSQITWNEADVTFCVLHLGGHILNGGIRNFSSKKAFNTMREEIKSAFQKSDIGEVIRLMDAHFGTHNYTLWHLFRDERRKVFQQILESTLKDIEIHYRQIYESEYPLMLAMEDLQIPMPKALSTPLDFILNHDLHHLLESERIDLEKLQQIYDNFKKWNINPEQPILGFKAAVCINRLMREFAENPDDFSFLETIVKTIELLQSLPMELDLWEAQNIFFAIEKEHFKKLEKQTSEDDETSSLWKDHFSKLGELLHIKI